MPLRFLTAGESHGPALTVVVEGLPAGVPVIREAIDRDLRRRMGGYGRGGRMKIEADRVEILGGVRFSRTLGSPVALGIANRDHGNWLEAMAVEGPPPEGARARPVTRPRPGHADLAGALKYGTHDAREILERASARETAARVAAGALARALLAAAGIEVTSRTLSVGSVSDLDPDDGDGPLFERLRALPDDAPFRAYDPERSVAMTAEVDRVRSVGDSIGGSFEVLARGVPPGLGSHVHWDRRIDGRIGGALLSIPAVKAASVGEGIESSARRGSETHDPIGWEPSDRRFTRSTNRAGGIEGGMTNGETLRVRGYLKPLATLARPLPSVDLVTKEPSEAAVERTDTIPIVAAGVVGEAMACLVLADELLIKFGGDRLEETLRNLAAYRGSLEAY
jgi:chorismate synthase